MPTKDNFSTRSPGYAKFRPVYPEALARWLMTLTAQKKNAWDCGTGNGQFACLLANGFEKVYATDISANQLAEATRKKNVFYMKVAAEKTAFPNGYFDLVTVAQAIHWFNFAEFYNEVSRTAVPGGILAVIGYSLLNIDQDVDRILNHFYEVETGSYWDPERKYIDEGYQTIPFPFAEIKAPEFKMEFQWDLAQFTGFIQTWSGVMHYIKARGHDPVPELVAQLSPIWKSGEKKPVTFPILLRVGKIK